MNLYSLTRRFPTEKDALDHLVRTRWPKGVRCVACDHGKCWPIESTNKTGGPRRLFQCADCKLQFSATAGTLFHDSHLPLTKWFAAISLMSDAKKGISASQLGRHIGMTYKTAWYVAHRIREAMREAKDIQLGDPDTTVEIDEAYIGGQLRHKGSKVAKAAKTMVIGWQSQLQGPYSQRETRARKSQ
jgi:transposase-like protein